LEVDILGPQTLAVRSHPALIREEAVVTALRRMADEIERQGESFSLEKVMSEAFATMACHSAVRAGKPMSLAEMKSLLQQMDTYSLSSFCPHGRPVFVEIPFAELERRFGRIV
jgi:DNA mismatch repair protein MutL